MEDAITYLIVAAWLVGFCVGMWVTRRERL
jgi:uncharacterized protein YneF (UPF0154 family)